MAIKDYVKPYNDDKMKYDFFYHRYILTTSTANSQTGLQLEELWQGVENLEWYLEYVSRVTYTYLHKFKQPKYRKMLSYFLSHSEQVRKDLIDIMVDVITYNFEDGGFLIAYQTGVNLKEMKELHMEIEMAVSVVAEQMIQNYELQDRYFNIEFTIEKDTYGTEW